MPLDTELLKDLDEGLGSDPLPAILWHYTTASCACAILKERSIRMGCHAFMNDPAEGTGAGKLVAECWASVVDNSEPHPKLDLAYLRDTSSVLKYFDFNRPELPPTFLLSLTELRDSLSQWSRYGDNGSGIALGFTVNPGALPPKSGKPWATGTKVFRVDYHAPELTIPSRVRSLMERLLLQYLPRFTSSTEVQNTLIALVHRLNPIVKHHAYAEEREWRVSTRTTIGSSDLYEIDCNRHGIAPYVPLQLGTGLILTELMLGPKLSAENAWSARWLCEKYDFQTTVSRSALAYR